MTLRGAAGGVTGTPLPHTPAATRKASMCEKRQGSVTTAITTEYLAFEIIFLMKAHY